jgi:hypothetical protein
MYIMYMALHITNPDVVNAVRALARDRGQSITDVIGTAVKDLRLRSKAASQQRATVEEMLELIRSYPSHPVDYSLSEDEILGFGPEGF